MVLTPCNKYNQKYAVKSTKNFPISFPKVREGGRTAGSGRVATSIE